MKRINILLTIVIAAMFAACSSHSFEDEAKKRLNNHVEKMLGGKTKSFSITDIENIYSDDSICILQCNLNGESYSGEKASIRTEYYLLWSVGVEKKLLENISILENGKQSIMDRVLKFEENLPEEKEKRSHALRAFIPGIDAFSIIEVKE